MGHDLRNAEMAGSHSRRVSSDDSIALWSYTATVLTSSSILEKCFNSYKYISTPSSSPQNCKHSWQQKVAEQLLKFNLYLNNSFHSISISTSPLFQALSPAMSEYKRANAGPIRTRHLISPTQRIQSRLSVSSLNDVVPRSPIRKAQKSLVQFTAAI